MSDRLKAFHDRFGEEEFVLPSGLSVLLRKAVKLEKLVAAGRIPNALVTQVNEAFKGKKSEGDFGIEEIQKLMPAINIVVMEAVIDPPITEERTEMSVCVHDMELEDRYAIFAKLNEVATDLKPFRGGPGQSGGTPLPGDDLQPASIALVGSDGRGGGVGSVSTGHGDGDDGSATPD